MCMEEHLTTEGVLWQAENEILLLQAELVMGDLF